MDMRALMALQRSQIETAAQVNQIVLQAAHSMALRQTTVLRQTFDDVAELAEQAAESEGPEALAGHQARLLQLCFERALTYLDELMTVTNETNKSALAVMQDRLGEIFERPADRRAAGAARLPEQRMD